LRLRPCLILPEGGDKHSELAAIHEWV
jgi:hypothetical protein